MNPKDYFNEFVWPNYQDFCADPTNRRLALNACVSASHMADCVAIASGSNPKDVRVTAANACKEFALIDDAANAYKHVTIDDKWPKGSRGQRVRELTELVEVQEGPGAAFTDGTYFGNGTSFADAKRRTTSLKVLGPDTKRHDLKYCLKQVMNYWKTILS